MREIKSGIETKDVILNSTRKHPREAKHFTVAAKIVDNTQVGWYFFTDANLKRAEEQAMQNQEDSDMLIYDSPKVNYFACFSLALVIGVIGGVILEKFVGVL